MILFNCDVAIVVCLLIHKKPEGFYFQAFFHYDFAKECPQYTKVRGHTFLGYIKF